MPGDINTWFRLVFILVEGISFILISNSFLFLANCWLISAAAGIIQNYNLFKKVVPFDNSFDNHEYCGAFHFRFWIYGEWKDVVIDDFLPGLYF